MSRLAWVVAPLLACAADPSIPPPAPVPTSFTSGDARLAVDFWPAVDAWLAALP